MERLFLQDKSDNPPGGAAATPLYTKGALTSFEPPLFVFHKVKHRGGVSDSDGGVALVVSEPDFLKQRAPFIKRPVKIYSILFPNRLEEYSLSTVITAL